MNEQRDTDGKKKRKRKRKQQHKPSDSQLLNYRRGCLCNNAAQCPVSASHHQSLTWLRLCVNTSVRLHTTVCVCVSYTIMYVASEADATDSADRAHNSSCVYRTCCLALGVLLFTTQTANKALNVSDSPQRSSGTAKRNKATLSGAIKQV